MALHREEALALIKQHVKKESLLKHMLAAEAIMRGTARVLGENGEEWGLTGLLHDIDFEEIGEDYNKHGIRGCEILEGKIDDKVLRAIKSHNYKRTGIMPQSRMEIALIASDAITGLIMAAAMVKGKKLSNVTVDTVANSFKKKGFAAGSDRNAIKRCEELGIPLDKFLEIGLKALQGIAADLGL
ncbi:MAG: HDIG domain-containing protein [Candidatus Aenigmatarchaeota archaeon]